MLGGLHALAAIAREHELLDVAVECRPPVLRFEALKSAGYAAVPGHGVGVAKPKDASAKRRDSGHDQRVVTPPHVSALLKRHRVGSVSKPRVGGIPLHKLRDEGGKGDQKLCVVIYR